MNVVSPALVSAAVEAFRLPTPSRDEIRDVLKAAGCDPEDFEPMPTRQVTSADALRGTEAVGRDGWTINFLPEVFLAPAICLEAVRSNPMALGLLPDGFLDRKTCSEAMRRNPDALFYVPKEWLDRAMCSEAVRRNPDVAVCVRSDLIDDGARTACLRTFAARRDRTVLEGLAERLRDGGVPQPRSPEP